MSKIGKLTINSFDIDIFLVVKEFQRHSTMDRKCDPRVSGHIHKDHVRPRYQKALLV
jgi:hypothetical protein